MAAQESPVVALTRALIERPSVTPDDAGCLDIISARLSQLGFDLARLPRGEVDNLWAIRGSQGPCLALAGHTDVVPPGDLSSWQRPPFQPTCEGQYLYGRGAADMKGSLAAMILAVERFLQKHPLHDGRIAFLLTSDEEGPATDGTVRLMEFIDEAEISIDWCLVGEPSSAQKLGDTVRVGRRGSLNGQLTVNGVQGHVAYPDAALNPIHSALAILSALSVRRWDEGNAYYPPTSFQITNVRSGTGAENVIPGSLEAWFNFRFSTEQTEAGLRKAVQDVCDASGLDYKIRWILSGNPFLTEGGRLIEATCAAIKQVTGLQTELSTGGGTSDGRFIAPRGIEVVELGPVNATIHKIDECVNVDDLDRLSTIYESIMVRLLTQTI
jgi:succinyl-diaminopimelate desuccinylase